MSTRDAHIVRLQRLDVTLNGSESDGFALQNRLSLLCHDWLLPALDRALERCAPAEGHWYIEHLEIDAGDMALDRLEQDFPDAVAHAVEAALREKTAAGNSSAPGEPSGGFKSEEQVSWEAFLHFLETGRLPWAYRLPKGERLETVMYRMITDRTGSRGHFGHFWVELTEKLRTPTVRRRLAQQFQSGFLTTLAARIAPEIERIAAQVLSEVRPYLAQEAFVSFEKMLWETALALAMGAATGLETPSIYAPLPEGVHSEPALRLLAETLSKTDHRKPFITAALRQAARQSQTSVLIGTALQMQAKTAVSFHLQPDIAPHPGPSHPDREGLYLDHAGLVLLHPFLPQFFTALQVAEGGALTQPDRALYLLHFLSTGKTSAPEYEQVFSKFLCGIPLEQPLDADIQLSDQEQEEAFNLLETVVRYWEVLQGTTPDGLREAFLQRPGKLSQRDGEWLLQIEKRSLDILLDQLPWGIAMIQLPWMPGLLRVEWA